MERARTVLEKALALRSRPGPRQLSSMRGCCEPMEITMVLPQRLRQVLAQYPRDRVALNDLGRIFFLQRKYADAVKVLNSVLEIDPEDLQAHYNLMLCYSGLGDEKQASNIKRGICGLKPTNLHRPSPGRTGRLHPEDNNERQAIHEHVSVPLPVLPASPRSKRQHTVARCFRQHSEPLREIAK